MIPHHQNAVSMAKVLLKHADVDAYEEFPFKLVYEIINVQNAQIQDMQAYLEGSYTGMCYEDSGCPPGCVRADRNRHLLFGSSPCGNGCVRR